MVFVFWGLKLHLDQTGEGLHIPERQACSASLRSQDSFFGYFLCYSSPKGVSKMTFLKKPHKWTEEVKIGHWRGCYMEHCSSGYPQPANKLKIKRDTIAPWCGPALICFRFSLAEISVLKIAFCPVSCNKALAYLLKFLKRHRLAIFSKQLNMFCVCYRNA